MLKKITAIVTALLLCAAFPIAVMASSDTPKLVDGAGLLSEQDFNSVEAALDEVSNQYDVDIAVLTVNGLDGKTIRDFSDDYYDENGYGTGEDHSGVLWVIDMDSRESYITTSGEGITAVTDYGKDMLAEQVTPYLAEGEYRDAMLTYVKVMDDYFTAERNGSPIDTYGDTEDVPQVEKTTSPGAYAAGAGISVLAGFGLSFAATGPMKRKMKSVRKQTSANIYADAEGFHLTENTDRYLYHRVVAVPIPKNEDSGSRGGGSSVHISSSGSTHGGGSLGKF